jgi:hypothetical protein
VVDPGEPGLGGNCLNGLTPALTLALSPRRGNAVVAFRSQRDDLANPAARNNDKPETIPPLLGGEGRGEDGRYSNFVPPVRSNTVAGAILKRYVYAYDKAGNRTGESVQTSVASSVTSAAHNNVNQLTSIAGGGQTRMNQSPTRPFYLMEFAGYLDNFEPD